MSLKRVVLALAFVAAMATAVHAVQPDELMSDSVKEARARDLSRELRCMVCQNQSIDDSEAPLAHDLRVLVRERLKAGDNDTQVLDFLVARYGEFVLLRPRLAWHNAVLWGVPPAVLLIGIIAIVVVIRRRRAAPALGAANLTATEEARLSELLRREG